MSCRIGYVIQRYAGAHEVGQVLGSGLLKFARTWSGLKSTILLTAVACERIGTRSVPVSTVEPNRRMRGDRWGTCPWASGACGNHGERAARAAAGRESRGARLPFVVNCEETEPPETFMTRGNAAELRGEAVGAAARALSFVLMPSGCTGCDGCENNARSAPVAK